MLGIKTPFHWLFGFLMSFPCGDDVRGLRFPTARRRSHPLYAGKQSHGMTGFPTLTPRGVWVARWVMMTRSPSNDSVEGTASLQKESEAFCGRRNDKGSHSRQEGEFDLPY